MTHQDPTALPTATDTASLLAQASTQWQTGDWESLAKLQRDTLQHHPDRAHLALLAAAGRLQMGKDAEAKPFIRLAQEWGANKQHIGQILIAGVHNSLGRAAMLNVQQKRALLHFQKAIHIVFADIGDASEMIMEVQADLLLQHCLTSQDIHAATDAVLADTAVSKGICFLLMLKLAQNFAANKDNLTATHYLRQGRHYFDLAETSAQVQFLELLVHVGRADTAADITMRRALQGLPTVPVNDVLIQKISHSYEQARALQDKKSEHGQDLLLDWLHKNLSKIAPTDAKRVVVEVGTTREDIPGQGSTEKIAEFCYRYGLNFITVDMDPHNSKMAQAMFKRKNMPFLAINQKGEDYLREYTGRIDFVFLDAYDFDHGNHSELRQSRYECFLGKRIDEQACHQMHLDCAESVLKKLAPDGVVCIDDTWLDENNRWTAKGTLAMPYLLENGFTLIEARNRAALLKPSAAGA